jgi:hypothetical protein
VFRTYYGPLKKSFAALNAVSQDALARELGALMGRFNRARDETLVIPSEYLEVVIRKRGGGTSGWSAGGTHGSETRMNACAMDPRAVLPTRAREPSPLRGGSGERS